VTVRPRSRGASPLPDYEPQLARLVKQAPEGDEWLHEMKYDGYRIGCRIDSGTATLISRNGKEWTDAFPEIVEAAQGLGVRQALLDGEVAMVLPDGRTSFQALQNSFTGGARRGLVYFVFDLLHAGGESFGDRPLEERKQELARLVGRPSASGRIRFSEHVVGHGGRMFAEACRLGLEGIISKRRDAPYRAGRADTWLKTKCVRRQEFVIGGFTDPEGARQGLGALLVGVYSGPNLTFAGKVGTGFTTRSARELRATLEQIAQEESPFTPRPPGWLGKHAHWVAPKLLAEVAFTEWTSDGRIRHPSFQGLRRDKDARSVSREEPADVPARRSARSPGASWRSAPRRSPAERGAAVRVAGVRISHPERPLYPDVPLSKRELAEYYERVGEWILPHLEGRPLTLVRCPTGLAGECFYMKHSKVWAPDAVTRVRIQEKTKVGEYLVANSVAAIVSLVQMNVLELHTWNSRVGDVERPDRIVLDIDPGAKVPWREVTAAARAVRTLLHAVDLESFPKTTGGAGLHVVVPLAPKADWRECLAFSRAAAEAMVRHNPDLYTTAFAKAGRERKILIDYLRNNRTNTSVAAFSTRAKEPAPVSVPVRWDEVKASLDPSAWTVSTIERRLARLRNDPWKDYWTMKQRLTPAMTKALLEA
jgi:bifunctional non-homologous end joining protein LigD